ncbi:MAG TPA: hypothetical protein VLA72_10890 [Anaerolineales bacterium]|nr:hypothetical protein [Anaerolineales bacterium]
MANNHDSKSSFPITAVIVGFVAIVAIVVVFAIEVSPTTLKPTQTDVLPTSSSSNGLYLPEVIPPVIELVETTQTATSAPTNTPVPTQTLLVIPTLVSNRDLPDLTVTEITEPICVPGYENTIIEFTIFVRNIGRARTGDFGSFDTDVFFILGQRRYSLEEWDTVFKGVVGTSVAEVFNLNPNDDIKFTIVIDLKGNKNFGIEAVANSGENPIREANMTNNTLIKYFSAACY